MSDLISRQEAIDAIRDMQAFEDDNGQPYLYLYDVMATFTDEEELPPIHPVNNSEMPNSSDVISRQAAIDAMAELQGSTSSKGVLKGISKAWKRIEQLPPIQPKRGKWIKYEQEFMLEGSLGTVQKTVRECSVCTAKIAGMVGIMNFCPNCGADMREVTT